MHFGEWMLQCYCVYGFSLNHYQLVTVLEKKLKTFTTFLVTEHESAAVTYKGAPIIGR